MLATVRLHYTKKTLGIFFKKADYAYAETCKHNEYHLGSVPGNWHYMRFPAGSAAFGRNPGSSRTGRRRPCPRRTGGGAWASNAADRICFLPMFVPEPAKAPYALQPFACHCYRGQARGACG